MCIIIYLPNRNSTYRNLDMCILILHSWFIQSHKPKNRNCMSKCGDLKIQLLECEVVARKQYKSFYIIYTCVYQILLSHKPKYDMGKGNYKKLTQRRRMRDFVAKTIATWSLSRVCIWLFGVTVSYLLNGDFMLFHLNKAFKFVRTSNVRV